MALIVLEKPNTPFLSVLSAQFQIFFTLPVFTSTEKKYSRLIVASVPQHTQNCTEVFDSTQQLLITIFVLETEEDQDMAGREGGRAERLLTRKPFCHFSPEQNLQLFLTFQTNQTSQSSLGAVTEGFTATHYFFLSLKQ